MAAIHVEFPMLSIDPCKMSNVDSNNANSLAGVWGVFHKCSRSLEDGHRLENMSWRLLSRKTIRTPSPSLPPTPPSSLSTPPSSDRALSHAASLERRRAPRVAPVENHIYASSLTPPRSPPSLSLERMVSSIQEKKSIEPLSPSITDALPKITTSPEQSIDDAIHRSSDSSISTAPPSGYESERSARPSVASDTSAEVLSCRSNSHSVVRGFTPGQSPASYRSATHLAPTESLAKIMSRTRAESVKKSKGFMLGGSSGDDDEESSFDERMQSQQQQPGQSSLTAGLKRPAAGEKKLSFRDVVESSKRLGHKSVEDEEVFESDSEDEEEDSDVDDDEEGDWEDDGSDDGGERDQPLFKRVDSKPNLVSRRSLITSMMNEEDRARAFEEQATQQAQAQAQAQARASYLKRSKTSSNVATQPQATSPEASSTAKPIVRTKSDIFSLVSSPKTTRRNMLSTEIDENLRRSILHERMQKKSTLNAYTKRVQSARNLTTLPIHEERDATAVSSGTPEIYRHGSNLYHEVGW